MTGVELGASDDDGPAFLVTAEVSVDGPGIASATTVGSFTAAEREAVGVAFADRLQTLS